MKREILNTKVSHNERWPRDGIMLVYPLLLSKGDLIYIKWQPREKRRTIKIEFEKADRKSRPLYNLFKKDIQSALEFTVNTEGLHNLCIENPKINEHGIGLISVFHESNVKPNRNPIPERYYKYEIKRQNNRLEKICVESGYREDIGSIEYKPINNTKLNELKRFYNSEHNGFFDFIETDKYITTSTIINTQLNEMIAIKINGLQNLHRGLSFSMYLQKMNSNNTITPLIALQAFKSNEETSYFLITKTYFPKGRNESAKHDFFSIELYSDHENNGKQNKWETVGVFNTLFNRIEKEIKQKKDFG